jgi:small Trp-rich protein
MFLILLTLKLAQVGYVKDLSWWWIISPLILIIITVLFKEVIKEVKKDKKETKEAISELKRMEQDLRELNIGTKEGRDKFILIKKRIDIIKEIDKLKEVNNCDRCGCKLNKSAQAYDDETVICVNCTKSTCIKN